MPIDHTPFNNYSNLFPQLRHEPWPQSYRSDPPLRHHPTSFNEGAKLFDPHAPPPPVPIGDDMPPWSGPTYERSDESFGFLRVNGQILRAWQNGRVAVTNSQVEPDQRTIYLLKNGPYRTPAKPKHWPGLKQEQAKVYRNAVRDWPSWMLLRWVSMGYKIVIDLEIGRAGRSPSMTRLEEYGRKNDAVGLVLNGHGSWDNDARRSNIANYRQFTGDHWEEHWLGNRLCFAIFGTCHAAGPEIELPNDFEREMLVETWRPKWASTVDIFGSLSRLTVGYYGRCPGSAWQSQYREELTDEACLEPHPRVWVGAITNNSMYDIEFPASVSPAGVKYPRYLARRKPYRAEDRYEPSNGDPFSSTPESESDKPLEPSDDKSEKSATFFNGGNYSALPDMPEDYHSPLCPNCLSRDDLAVRLSSDVVDPRLRPFERERRESP